MFVMVTQMCIISIKCYLLGAGSIKTAICKFSMLLNVVSVAGVGDDGRSPLLRLQDKR